MIFFFFESRKLTNSQKKILKSTWGIRVSVQALVLLMSWELTMMIMAEVWELSINDSSPTNSPNPHHRIMVGAVLILNFIKTSEYFLWIKGYFKSSVTALKVGYIHIIEGRLLKIETSWSLLHPSEIVSQECVFPAQTQGDCDV